MPVDPIREAEVEAYFCALVRELGGEVRKVGWIGRRGAPDRFVMLPGHSPNFWAEIKRPGGKLDPHQQREIDRMRGYDEIVHVIDSFTKADAVLAAYRGGGR